MATSDDVDNVTKNSGTNDGSELPLEDDAAKKVHSILPREDESPVDPLEKRETCTKHLEREYAHNLHSMHAKNDEDKLKRLASQHDIDPDLLHMFWQFTAFIKAMQANAGESFKTKSKSIAEY